MERRIEAEKIRVGQRHVSKAKESLLNHFGPVVAGLVVNVRGGVVSSAARGAASANLKRI